MFLVTVCSQAPISFEIEHFVGVMQGEKVNIPRAISNKMFILPGFLSA